MDDVKQSVMTQPKKIRHIIKKSTEYFGISEDFFFKKAGTRNNVHRIKRYIAYILSNETELLLSDIAELLGYYNKDVVSVSISKLKEELSDNFYGNNKTKMIYNELLSYLNLKS